MHDEVKNAFRMGIAKAGAILQPLVHQFKEMHLVWTKQGDQWRGEGQERPALTTLFARSNQDLDAAGREFNDLLRRYHPQYAGLVGFLGQRINLTHSPSYILSKAMLTLWERHHTFQPNGAAIEPLIQEFADFIDNRQVRLRFIAQLLNYRMDADTLALVEGLTIRRLSEQEVTDLHGGPVWLGFGARKFTGDEYVIEGECNADLTFGNTPDAEPSILEEIRPKLDKAILALRTFKEGRIGYDYVQPQPLTFSPIEPNYMIFGDLHVPRGQYTISTDEMMPLRQHAQLIWSCSEPAMKLACSRLADAQTRSSPQDQLLDAVVGLEALLLAGLRHEDRRGELKFRFSLNYSTLFNTPEERHHAFRVAKHLYDLRSIIAHGGLSEAATHPVGDERLNLCDAAIRASAVLRDVIHRFLPQAGQHPYKNHQFWERGYFGLSS